MSLLDYIGYGTTGAAWFMGNKAPIEVTTVVDDPPGLEVDEHSITVARYDKGLAKFETRWGTFTDPWVHQPQPKCGFVFVGTGGTLSAYEKEPALRRQTSERPEGEDIPLDGVEPPHQDPIQYVIHCLENDRPIEGMLSIETSRVGQQITDAAVMSAREKRTVPLVG